MRRSRRMPQMRRASAPHVRAAIVLWAGLSALLGATGACAAIADIEDARVDPTLDLDGIDNDSGAGARGGSGGAPSGGNGGGGGGGGPMTPSEVCDHYCSVVMANCQGPDEVYVSGAICREACLSLPLGTPDDTSGNTVGCRLRNAELAAATGEPGVHCPAAGPGGDGICGPNCAGYCSLMLAHCNAPDFDLGDCAAACADVTDPGGYSTAITSGDTLQCRLYHVSAATLDPQTHCIHAAGIELCVP